MGVLKKNQNTPRPSEHPPVIMGSKVSFMYRCRRNPGNYTKLFVTKDQPLPTSDRPSGHKNV